MQKRRFCVEIEMDIDKYLRLDFYCGMKLLGGDITAVQFAPLDEHSRYANTVLTSSEMTEKTNK